MKLDRRSFIALGVGGTIGTTLSPLPWKLTDDSSIWSQNWPWTPVPPDGEATYTDTACTLCPGGCGITVRKIDNRVVKIEGMAGHPVNQGGACILGLAGPQLLYSPTRVKSPMKKVGNRWRKISWEEAIATVVEKMQALRQAGKPNAVACITAGGQGTVSQLWSRLLSVYGSPNLMQPATAENTYTAAMYRAQGGQARPGYDIENADFVLSFGAGLLDGWGAPVRMFRAHSQWKKHHGKLVQVDVRLSNTAAKADRWVPINPGTEKDLALGMAHVILKESLYHRYFIDAYSAGFDAWRGLVMTHYAPEKVAASTGVPVETIKSLGREFARANNPIAVCGRGDGQTPGSLGEAAAVHALNALVGNINRKGGVWSVPEADYIQWPDVEMDGVAAEGMQTERIDGAGGPAYPDAGSLMTRLPEALDAGGDIQLLLVSGTNPAYTLPDSKAVKKAFANIPMTVSFSSYLDETTAMADLVMPNHCFLERYEDVPVAAGLPRPLVGLARPVVDPLYDTKHVGDVIIALANGIGGNAASAFPWDTYQRCLEETLGDKWDPLNESVYWQDTAFTPSEWMSSFETESGKFEFPNRELVKRTPVAAEGDPGKYPLVLVPFDTMRLASGYIGSPPFLIKAVADTTLKDNDMVVEINPATATRLSLRDGKAATLTTPRGSVRVRVHLYHGIKPGVVAMARGLGHSAYDKYLGGKGVSINALMGPIADPDTGMDAAWGVRARLTNA